MSDVTDRIKDRIREMKEEKRRLISDIEVLTNSMSEIEQRIVSVENKLVLLEDITGAINDLEEKLELKSNVLHRKEADAIKKLVVEDLSASVANMVTKENDSSYDQMKSAVLEVLNSGLEKNKQSIDELVEKEVQKAIVNVQSNVEKVTSKELERSIRDEMDEIQRLKAILHEDIKETIVDEMKDVKETIKHDIPKTVKIHSKEEASRIQDVVSTDILKMSTAVDSLKADMAKVTGEVTLNSSTIDEVKITGSERYTELSKISDLVSAVREDVERKESEMKDELKATLRGAIEVREIVDGLRVLDNERKSEISQVSEASVRLHDDTRKDIQMVRDEMRTVNASISDVKNTIEDFRLLESDRHKEVTQLADVVKRVEDGASSKIEDVRGDIKVAMDGLREADKAIDDLRIGEADRRKEISNLSEQMERVKREVDETVYDVKEDIRGAAISFDEVQKERERFASRVKGNESAIKLTEEMVANLEKAVNSKLSSIDELKVSDFEKSKKIESLNVSFNDIKDSVTREIDSAKNSIRAQTDNEIRIMKKDAENLRTKLESQMSEKIRTVDREVTQSLYSAYDDAKSKSLAMVRDSVEQTIDRKLQERWSNMVDQVSEGIYTKAKKNAQVLMDGKEQELRTNLASEVNMLAKSIEDRVKADLENIVYSFKEDIKMTIVREITSDMLKRIEKEMNDRGTIRLVGFDEEES